MSSAFDHILNALDVVLKAGDRRAQEEQAQRSAAKKKRTTKIRGFGERREPATDPSCCIVKRDGGDQ